MMKKVPKRRFKGFLNAGDWEQRKLGELVTVFSGRDYKHLSEGDIPVYGTGGYMLSVNEALSNDQDAIGIGRKGTIDKPYILKAPFWTVDTLFYAIPKEKMDLNFIFCIFKNVDWRKLDESTGVPSLSKSTITNVDVYCPFFEEQLLIGRFFSWIDSSITLHQRKLEKLQATKKALLYELFPIENSRRPKRRFKGFTDDWEQRKLISCIQKVIDFRGRTPNKLGMEWSCSGHLALSALNVKDGYIDFSQDNHYGDNDLYEKWMTGNELHKGQVVFTTEAPMGNVAQIPDNERYILSQRTVAFCVDENIITENFLAVLLRTPVVFKTLTKLSSGGTAQGISQKSLAEIEVRIPPNLHEQQIISNFLLSFEHCITLHQEESFLHKNMLEIR